MSVKIHHSSGLVWIEGDGFRFETYKLAPSTTNLHLDLHLKYKEAAIKKECMDVAYSVLRMIKVVDEPPTLVDYYREVG